jgi:hypothetical protein
MVVKSKGNKVCWLTVTGVISLPGITVYKNAAISKWFNITCQV